MKNIIFSLGIACLVFASNCEAQGVGTDMWTQDFMARGLYTPHIDNCSGSEGFVPVGGTERGFCIDKAERSTATFELAREDCANEGKRLPEPAEYKTACTNAGSLSLANMTDDFEWSSNAPTTMFVGGASIAVAVMGNTSCTIGSFTSLADDYGDDTRPYRCVH